MESKISEKLFNRVLELANKLRKESAKLDIQIRKEYEFHYSDADIDEIIDCLDYGQGTISFRKFIELMNEEKEKRKNA